jgi:hypothetical protein
MSDLYWLTDEQTTRLDLYSIRATAMMQRDTDCLVFASQASVSVYGYCFHVLARMIDATRQRKPLSDINNVFQALQCRPRE